MGRRFLRRCVTVGRSLRLPRRGLPALAARRPGAAGLRPRRRRAHPGARAPADHRQRAAHRRASRRRGLGVHRADGARRSRARRPIWRSIAARAARTSSAPSSSTRSASFAPRSCCRRGALDGGEQFFTRTFDYGFSKTREEAAAKWDEREVLGDMVRVIRIFRPLVIYSRFTGTPADGHGQHQMAGYLTPLAFRAAADPSEFPEQIARRPAPVAGEEAVSRRRLQADPANPPTVQVQTGVFDPVIGRTLCRDRRRGPQPAQVAGDGRASSRAVRSASALRLRRQHASCRPRHAERSIFEGIDIDGCRPRRAGRPACGALRSELAAIDAAARQALDDYEPLEPARIVPTLADGLRATRAARAALKSLDGHAPRRAPTPTSCSRSRSAISPTRWCAPPASSSIRWPTRKPSCRAARSASRCARSCPDASPVQGRAAPRARRPTGWTRRRRRAERRPRPARAWPAGAKSPTHAARYRVTVPADAPLTQPYFLAEPRDGRSAIAGPTRAPKGLPFAPPLAHRGRDARHRRRRPSPSRGRWSTASRIACAASCAATSTSCRR